MKLIKKYAFGDPITQSTKDALVLGGQMAVNVGNQIGEFFTQKQQMEKQQELQNEYNLVQSEMNKSNAKRQAAIAAAKAVGDKTMQQIQMLNSPDLLQNFAERSKLTPRSRPAVESTVDIIGYFNGSWQGNATVEPKTPPVVVSQVDE